MPIQVDVQTLKDELLGSIRQLGLAVPAPAATAATPDTQLGFQRVVCEVVGGDSQAGRPADISVHLCFICLLHLANEHGLRLETDGRLDRLMIPAA